MAAVAGSIGEGRFVVMRFKRVKTWAHVYQIRRHNTREMECPHTERDAPKPHLIVGSEDIAGDIREVLGGYEVEHKPGEVLALEFVVSTSREVFEGLDGKAHQERNGQFLACAIRAFYDRFKIPGQIVSIAQHLDERTPHLHLVVVPLVYEIDKRRSDPTPFYRLSAKRVIGGRGDMAREQTRFASFFKPMGLARGREGQGARHVSNREHEAMLEAARQAALVEREGLAADRKVVADCAVQVANDRDTLAAERAKLSVAREQLRQEEERLAAARATLAAESEALKKRVMKRVLVLRDLMEAGEKMRDFVLSLPAERQKTPMHEACAMSDQLATASRTATQDDAWLAAALAVRPGYSLETGR